MPVLGSIIYFTYCDLTSGDGCVDTAFRDTISVYCEAAGTAGLIGYIWWSFGAVIDVGGAIKGAVRFGDGEMCLVCVVAKGEVLDIIVSVGATNDRGVFPVDHVPVTLAGRGSDVAVCCIGICLGLVARVVFGEAVGKFSVVLVAEIGTRLIGVLDVGVVGVWATNLVA